MQKQPQQVYKNRKYLYDPIEPLQKLPSRGILKADPLLWNKEVAELNGKNESLKSTPQTPYIYYVKGKVYNLEKFMDKHPGGRVFLELTKGQDITESYITHHLNESKTDAILNKYYVKDQANYQPRFSFEEKGFYRTLQKKIQDKVGKNAKLGYTQKSVNVAISVILLWFLSFFLMAYNQSIFLAIVTGIFGHAMLGIGHNFFHQKPNIFRYCFDFTNFNHYNWITSHTLSHHPFSNTEQDMEITALEPFLVHMTSQPAQNKVMAMILMYVLGILLPIGSLIRQNFITIFQGTFRKEFTIVYVQYFTILCFSGFDYYFSFMLWFIMHAVQSILMTNATFMNHRTEYAWSSGDKPIQDFGEHVVLTAHDHSVNLPFFWSILIFAGFNDHIIHHMFPAIDKSYFPQFRGIFEETIREFNLDYKVQTISDIFQSVFNNFERKRPTEKDPNSKKQN